jgi:hypothetical protein
MNFYPSHTSSPHQGRCDRHRRTNSSSRMWRNSTKVIKALMSNSGKYCLASLQTAFLRLGHRYFIRVSISRRMADVNKEKDLWVHSFRMPPDSNNAIKMEVGIEDCLHIEFEYNKSKYDLSCGSASSIYSQSTRYHLKDVIVGKIYFLLVRIKIKHMELSIIRRETTGAPPNQYNESETITKFEIMDGAPVKGKISCSVQPYLQP